ncbi:MAG: DUF3090 family protein [Acidimicrobiia bacterium]
MTDAPDPIELDPVDALAAGAVGEPGERAFYIQARKEAAQLTVLVEKEQVAHLAAEAVAFLERLEPEFPEDPSESEGVDAKTAALSDPTDPLFRARLIGLGFDPERKMVVIELHERTSDDDADDDEVDVAADEELSGWVAKLVATRPQVRAMAARGVEAVAAGRPRCTLCEQPMDPDGHICPRWN